MSKLRGILGAAAVLTASQASLVLLYRGSARFSGYRWAPNGPVPDVVPISSFPWATWTAFLTATVLLPLLYEKADHRSGIGPIGFRSPVRRHRAAALTLCGSGLVLACVLLTLRLRHQSLLHSLAPGNALFFFVHLGVMALGEETLFRGALQRRLASALGLLPGLVLASVLWSFLGHLRAPFLENLFLRLPAGVVLGVLYADSESLYPPILVHWAMNLIVV